MLLNTRISQFDYIFLSVLAVDSGWAGKGGGGLSCWWQMYIAALCLSTLKLSDHTASIRCWMGLFRVCDKM